MTRIYKLLPLGEILGLRFYDGPPIDPSAAPHCIELQTQNLVYYTGENLEWYQKSGMTPHLPRRESGIGMTSARGWADAIRRALMPPQGRNNQAANGGSRVDAQDVQATQESALEFSNLYQIFPDEVLGTGQFGTVYAGVQRTTRRSVAIKEIVKDRTAISRKWREALRNEVGILQKLTHPGIITLEAMFEFPDRIYVVMEKMKADMLEMILSNKEGRLSERVTKFLIVQILQVNFFIFQILK